jgi:hypothetical protein
MWTATEVNGTRDNPHHPPAPIIGGSNEHVHRERTHLPERAAHRPAGHWRIGHRTNATLGLVRPNPPVGGHYPCVLLDGVVQQSLSRVLPLKDLQPCQTHLLLESTNKGFERRLAELAKG